MKDIQKRIVSKDAVFTAKDGNRKTYKAYEKRRAVFGFEVKEGSFRTDENTGESYFDAIVSPPTVDRHGEIVLPKGAVVSQKDGNVIILLNHNRDKILGRTYRPPIPTDSGVELAVRVTKADYMQDYILQVKERLLIEMSIAFIPLVVTLNDDDVWVVEQWDFVECSVVSTPSNVGSIIKAYEEHGETGSDYYRNMKMKAMDKDISDLVAKLNENDAEIESLWQTVQDLETKNMFLEKAVEMMKKKQAPELETKFNIVDMLKNKSFKDEFIKTYMSHTYGL